MGFFTLFLVISDPRLRTITRALLQRHSLTFLYVYRCRSESNFLFLFCFIPERSHRPEGLPGLADHSFSVGDGGPTWSESCSADDVCDMGWFCWREALRGEDVGAPGWGGGENEPRSGWVRIALSGSPCSLLPWRKTGKDGAGPCDLLLDLLCAPSKTRDIPALTPSLLFPLF